MCTRVFMFMRSFSTLAICQACTEGMTTINKSLSTDIVRTMEYGQTHRQETRRADVERLGDRGMGRAGTKGESPEKQYEEQVRGRESGG